MSKEEKSEEKTETKKKGGLVKILMIVIGGVILVGGSAGGALYFTGMFDKNKEVASKNGEPETAAPAEQRERALYIPLDPPFVINLDDNGTLRFLQINVSLMAREKSIIEEMGANTPRLKNDLLMLFAGQNYDDLQRVDGREKLRQDALKLVQDIMLEISNVRGVEELYFTSFVVQ